MKKHLSHSVEKICKFLWGTWIACVAGVAFAVIAQRLGVRQFDHPSCEAVQAEALRLTTVLRNESNEALRGLRAVEEENAILRKQLEAQ